MGILKVRGLILRARHSTRVPWRVISVFRPIGDVPCGKQSSATGAVISQYQIGYTYWGRPKYDEKVREDNELFLPISVARSASWRIAEENETKLLREDFGVRSKEELVSRQKELLKYGFIRVGETWCGDEVPNMKLEQDQNLIA
jgi:hypothetical protein